MSNVFTMSKIDSDTSRIFHVVMIAMMIAMTDYASSLNVMLATRCRRDPKLGTQLVCLNRATFFLEAS
jgi:hypothetical protein